MYKKTGKNVYDIVTERMIAALQEGKIPWKQPWISVSTGDWKDPTVYRNGAYSHETGKPYSLLNQLLLGKEGEYVSKKEVMEKGNLKDGAEPQIVTYWKMNVKEATDEDGNPILDNNGEPVKKMFPILKYYTVYHIDDCEGIKRKYNLTLPSSIADKEKPKIKEVEAVLLGYANNDGLQIKENKSDSAYYVPVKDTVFVPLRDQFADIQSFYATEIHEIIHSTGNKKRLDRLEEGKFGSDPYAKEELVAEIGSACLCNLFNIETEETIENSKAYVQSWIKKLKDNPKWIVSASGKAEKAINYIYEKSKATAIPAVA